MINYFKHYKELQSNFAFHSKWEAGLLVIGGVILSILDLLGVTAVFPLMLLILDPESVTKGAILGTIYNFFGFTSPHSFALFLVVVIIGLFAIKVIFHLCIWRYEFSLLNEWRIKISSKIYHSMLHAKFENINKESSSSLLNIITSAIPYVISNYVHQCINLMQTIIMSSMILCYMMYINLSLFLGVVFSGAVIIFGFIFLQRKKIKELGGKQHTLSKELLSVLQQSISGYKETKIHQKEVFFQSKFDKTSKNIARNELSLLFVQALPNVLIEFIAILIIFSAFGIMLLMFSNLHTSAAQISVVVILGIRIIPILNRAITTMTLIRSSLEPIEQIIETYQNLGNDGDDLSTAELSKIPPLSFNKEITLKNISYSYQGTNKSCLNHIDMVIKKGEQLGIVGASGSGKTTLINIILGFLTDYKGDYYIDERSINNDEAIASLRKIISFVDQQPFLLDADFITNVAFGVDKKDVDKKRVINCLKNVGLMQHIESLTDGLETTVGENGKFLSGGQRQKLVIARALYKGAKIIILDEATSALDMESESTLIELLDTLKNKITVISIAHRLSTLRQCDKIVFLEDGKISAEGTFKELYKINDTFVKYVKHSMLDVT